MNGLQALNYGLTGIATGGFGITSGSIGDCPEMVPWTMATILLLGAFNFATYTRLFAGQVLAFLRASQTV